MRKYKNIISLMSGTSIDSIDACYVRIFEDLTFKVISNYSLSYPEGIRAKLLELANGRGMVKEVCLMNFAVGEMFAKCVNELLKKFNIKKD